MAEFEVQTHLLAATKDLQEYKHQLLKHKCACGYDHDVIMDNQSKIKLILTTLHSLNPNKKLSPVAIGLPQHLETT